MVAIKTTAKVDQSRTLAVLLPQCGVAEGEYEVLVVLAGAEEPARAPLAFSNHRLGTQAGRTWSRSEIYDDNGR